MASVGALVALRRKYPNGKQREALEAAFQAADKNGDGYLSADEYYMILKDHGLDCSYDEIKTLIQIADKDRDGKISREEYSGGNNMQPKGKHMDPDTKAMHKADLAFKAFDKNNDGYVTKSEVMQIAKKLTKEQVDVVFQRHDGDNDGKLSREEFKEFMQKAASNK